VPNVAPSAYRQVSVADVDVPLDEASLRRFFVGRECYRRTEYIVVRRSPAVALVTVATASRSPLFAPITTVELLAGRDDAVYVVDPDIDTGVVSQLARAAAAHPGARCVIVEGRYHHVSFLLDPAPIRVRVREVVPPWPAKLLDQARRVLDVAEDLPPMVLQPELIELSSLSPAGGDILLPCRGTAITLGDTPTWYLDQRPPRHDWTLLGCARSREIHRWFYGDDAPGPDTCPRRMDVGPDGDRDELVLTKCCLLEDSIEVLPRGVVVPWGASLEQIRAALRALATLRDPSWQPV
jgi:hypothetical protein